MKNLKPKILMTGPNPNDPGGISTSVRCFLSLNKTLKYNIEHFLTGKPITQNDTLFRYIKRNLSQFVAFFSLFLHTQYSLVHIHTSSWGGFWRTSLYVIVCKFMSIPVILHIHGAEFKTFFNRGFIRQKLIKSILSNSDALIVLSTAWEKFFVPIVPKQNVFVLENMVEIPTSKAQYSSEKINFLFLGGLTKRKGLQELINVIPYFVKSKHKLKFTIAGFSVPKEAKLREKIENLAHKFKSSNILDFLPDITEDEKIDLLLKSQVYILQSYDEGLPFSLLEAMSYGLCPITSPVGAIPEVITDGVNGFLIDAGDSHALKEKIEHFLSDTSLIQKMMKRNIKKIESDFGINKLKTKITKLYSKIDN